VTARTRSSRRSPSERLASTRAVEEWPPVLASAAITQNPRASKAVGVGADPRHVQRKPKIVPAMRQKNYWHIGRNHGDLPSTLLR